MNHNKEAKSLTFWRGSEVGQDKHHKFHGFIGVRTPKMNPTQLTYSENIPITSSLGPKYLFDPKTEVLDRTETLKSWTIH